MAFIDSGWRFRLLGETVRRFSRVPSCGLLIRLPRGFTERSTHPRRVRLLRCGGQLNEETALGEKLPLNCRRWRVGGQSEIEVSSVVRLVDRGRRRMVSLVRWRSAVLSRGKGIGSLTRERSRCRRLWHLDSAGRLLELEWNISYCSGRVAYSLDKPQNARILTRTKRLEQQTRLDSP